MNRRLRFAAGLVALAGCYVTPPPNSTYQPPPQQQYSQPPPAYNQPPPQQQYNQPPPAYSQPPPAYNPPPVATQPPPPPDPQYAPPDPGGDYTDIDEVPPDDSAPTVDVFTDALSPYGTWTNDARYGRVWIPSDPSYQPYTRGYWQPSD